MKLEVKINEKFVEVITFSLTKGASFPVTIAGINCNTLIDTDDTRSCMSETFYNQLLLPWLLKTFHLSVTSAYCSTCVQWELYNVHLN